MTTILLYDGKPSGGDINQGVDMSGSLEDLKKYYQVLPNYKIKELILERQGGLFEKFLTEPLVEGAYDLLLEEAQKRGIDGYIKEEIKINSEIDNGVSLHATTGIRFLNWSIDFIIHSGLTFILFFILCMVIGNEAYYSFLKSIGQLGLIGVSCLVFFLYYFIFESTIQRTPAKFFTGTKVLDIKGLKPTKLQILKRTLSRIVPFEMLSGLGKKKWRGWHDQWSHTMVVNKDYPGIDGVIKNG